MRFSNSEAVGLMSGEPGLNQLSGSKASSVIPHSTVIPVVVGPLGRKVWLLWDEHGAYICTLEAGVSHQVRALSSPHIRKLNSLVS